MKELKIKLFFSVSNMLFRGLIQRPVARKNAFHMSYLIFWNQDRAVRKKV